MTSTKVSVRMPMEQYRFLEELAQLNNRPLSEEIRSHLPIKPTIKDFLEKKTDIFKDNAIPDNWDDLTDGGGNLD